MKELKGKIQQHLHKWIKNEIRLNNKLEQTEFVLDKTFEGTGDEYLFNFYRGEVYRLKGDIDDNYEKAIDYYNKSIKEKNDFPDVYRELGLLQLKNKENDKAKKNFKKYLEIAKNPKDASIIQSYIN